MRDKDIPQHKEFLDSIDEFTPTHQDVCDICEGIGILWSVTARTIIVVLARWLPGPSACSALRCRCGIALSSMSRNSIPSQNPIKAGMNESLPIPSDCSIAGMIRLHTDAATITPPAKPDRAFCNCMLIPFFIKNTQAPPAEVPIKGINKPVIISSVNIVIQAESFNRLPHIEVTAVAAFS